MRLAAPFSFAEPSIEVGAASRTLVRLRVYSNRGVEVSPRHALSGL